VLQGLISCEYRHFLAISGYLWTKYGVFCVEVNENKFYFFLKFYMCFSFYPLSKYSISALERTARDRLLASNVLRFWLVIFETSVLTVLERLF